MSSPTSTLAPELGGYNPYRALQVRVFALTWLSYVSFYMTRKNLSQVKVRLESELDVSKMDLGTIDSLYLIAYCIGQFISGSLGDRYGARKLISVGMIATAGASWLFGMSSTTVLFGIIFGLNGFFQSTGWSNNVKAMMPWFGRSSRGRVMGFWCTNYALGGMIAAFLATWLLSHYGWRAAFYVPAVWVGIMGMAIFFLLVEQPEDKGLTPIADPSEQPLETREDSSDVPREARARGYIFKLMRTHPEILSYGAAYFCLKMIRYSLWFWLPYYLETVGYGEIKGGYMSIAFNAGGILGTITFGWLSDFFLGRRARIALYGLPVLTVALWLYQIFGATSVTVNILLMALVGFALFGPDSILVGATAQDIGGRKAAASAAGIVNGIGSVGAILGGIGPAWISDRWGWDAVFSVFIVMSILAALMLIPTLYFKKKQ